MADDSQEVADIIDGLGDSPAPLEVYNATRDYDTRYLASAGAAAAAAGGGGGSQPGAVRVLKHDFDFSQAEALAAGVAVWTPAVGDVLLNAWVETTVSWAVVDVSAGCDIGVVIDGAWAHIDGYPNSLISRFGTPPDMSNNIWAEDPQIASYSTSKPLASTEMQQVMLISTTNQESGALPVQVRFKTTDPLSLVVSGTTMPGGPQTDATEGQSTLYIVVSSPATTP